MRKELRMDPRFLACINAWSVIVFIEKGRCWGNKFHFRHRQGFEGPMRHPGEKCLIAN